MIQFSPRYIIEGFPDSGRVDPSSTLLPTSARNWVPKGKASRRGREGLEGVDAGIRVLTIVFLGYPGRLCNTRRPSKVGAPPLRVVSPGFPAGATLPPLLVIRM